MSESGNFFLVFVGTSWTCRINRPGRGTRSKGEKKIGLAEPLDIRSSP